MVDEGRPEPSLGSESPVRALSRGAAAQEVPTEGHADERSRGRSSVTVVLFAVAAAAAAVLIVNLLGTPPTVEFSSPKSGPAGRADDADGRDVRVGEPPHLGVVPGSLTPGEWEHTTLFQVPQHTRINVTIYQYDSGSPLRNQQLGQVSGTEGDMATLNGKEFSVNNSNEGNGVGHTFSMPGIGAQRPALRQQRQRQPLRRCALHHVVAEQRDPVLLHHPRTRQLPLAVLRPVWVGFPVR